ncbi:SLC13 family permease [Shewanella violacea]|uniref:Transporter, sodium/sulfate symporter family n=1 Tax=Shewanella violacea (strain JCM 10179 / CIP 106290 / LMG 19151 / DSS12) TaxID=637905 RepID=D4ZIH3_SHEVD|nr:SLC13 family permease [Shewanella violacea]BAJ01472.1 transporter, sodium/sulfate symporter family [Shewanella violacea DSS12]
MSLDAYLTIGIFVATIAGLIRYQSRPAVVFGVALLVLVGLNLVSREQLLSSMSNPGLVTLVLLILCSFALEKTRLLRVIASKVIVSSYNSTWIRLFGVTALSSAMLNNTAVVATLLSPIRNNPHHVASKLLLPLSYAAILGGTLTLIGTSTNLIVNSLYIDATSKSLSFFSFTAVGIMLVVGCGLVLRLASRWLPNIEHKETCSRGYFIDAKVIAGSELIGRSVEDNGLRHLESLFLVEVVRDGRLISPVTPTEVLLLNDRLIFSGDITKMMQLSQFSGLEMFAEKNGLLDSNLTEVVIKQESVLIDKTLKGSGFRALFDAAVVAIRRDGEEISGKLGEVVIKAGDFLILAVGEDFKSRRNISKNFIVISGVEPEVRINGAKAWLSIGGFVFTIALAATGVIEMLQGMLLLLGVLIFSKCLNVNEVVRRFPVDIWLIVSTAILLSHALVNTGVVDLVAHWVNSTTDKDHLYLALILVYVATWLMTELITNNAAAALMFPIAYSIALGFGVDILPFVMTVAFAASGSFISPYGYQTNLMVYNAGNYRIIDFIKVGLPVSLTYGVIVLMAVPVFFPF